MKSGKVFIILIFLLSFAFQVSGQTQQPKIVWRNLQEKYVSFADIKPGIVNNGKKTLFLDTSLPWNILVFDEQNQRWDFSKYREAPADYSGLKYGFIKIESKRK